MIGKIKVSKKLKFTTTAFLMMFGSHNQGNAQSSAQATMSVSVRVVPGPQFIDKVVTDITDQLQERKQFFSLGQYSMKFPDNDGYTISIDPVIKMKGKSNSWDIQTAVDSQKESDGMFTLNLSGQSTAQTVLPDTYVGELTTNIEYL